MDNLVVRPGRAEDLAALTDLYNHYVVHTAITFDIEPFSIEARADWFAHYRSDGPHRLLVASTGDTVAGYATSSPFRQKAAYATTVETSVYCHPDWKGRGIGSALYTELFAALAGEDVRRACAGITLPNEASIALHRKFGFHDVGVHTEVGRKLGQFWDVLMLERPLP
ncbi:MAG TPA: GNAT family N-acetyltransferase [Thermoleophilia bacterium]|nr:GNAT family N-acetyltransferase [Thermoleophilia bacterium]